MSALKDERRLTDGDFWDMAALDAVRGFAGDPDASVEGIARDAAEVADALLAERRKRREGGA